MGCIAFSPLAQGLLTNKYLNGVPENSRANAEGSFQKDFLSEENLKRVRALNEIASGPRPDIGADGDCVGAARQASHFGADRSA